MNILFGVIQRNWYFGQKRNIFPRKLVPLLRIWPGCAIPLTGPINLHSTIIVWSPNRSDYEMTNVYKVFQLANACSNPRARKPLGKSLHCKKLPSCQMKFVSLSGMAQNIIFG